MRRTTRQSTNRGASLLTITIVSLALLATSSGPARGQVGGIELPPLTTPTLPTVTVPNLLPTSSTSTSSTTSTTVKPAPKCDNFSLSNPHPQWGQALTLAPKGTFGSEPGTVRIVGLGANGTPDYSKSGSVPLQPGTGWNSGSLAVNLPTAPPNPDIDQWTMEVVSGEVRCAVNVPVLRVLDCNRLPWGVQNAWRLKSSLTDLNNNRVNLGESRNDPLSIPIGPADRLNLQYERLLDSVNRLPVPTSLTDVLNLQGGAIRFAFSISDGRAEEFHVDHGNFGFDANPPNSAPPDSQSANLTVLPRPVAVPADKSAADPARPDQYKRLSRTLSLDAMVTLPTDYCQALGSAPHTIHLLSVPLEQAPMVFPTIGAFFLDTGFGGDALAFVHTGEGAPSPPGMTLPAAGAKFDGKSDPNELRLMVTKVATALELLSAQAAVLQPNFPAGLPSSNRDGTLVQLPSSGTIRLQADQLRGAKHPAVVAGTGLYKLAEIVRDGSAWCCSDFGDQISSVTIVGFPEGPRLQLRDCANWPWCDQHNIWTFQVRSGRFVASVSDLGSDFSDKADELNAIR